MRSTRARRPLRSARGAARTVVILLLLVVAAGLGVAWWWLSGAEEAPPPKVEAEAPSGPMTEAERLAYVKAHVALEGLEVGPDTKPGTDEPVPGLLKVEGEIVNEGAREVEKVIVAIYPKNAAGEVIAQHLEDVLAKGTALAPGGRRSFSFTIPQRGEAEGDFGRELR